MAHREPIVSRSRMARKYALGGIRRTVVARTTSVVLAAMVKCDLLTPERAGVGRIY